MEKPIFDPSIPFLGPIQEGNFSPGKLIRIQGTIPASAYRFNINLQCGAETVPRDDMALQITVRLLDGYVSLNSLQNGHWGEQQRGSTFPVKRAEKFEIVLICDYSHYKIEINGQRYCNFPQRIHYNRITHLTIDGDVSIVQISYESVSGSGRGAIFESELNTDPPLNEFDVTTLIDNTKVPPVELRPVGFSGLDNTPGPSEKFSPDEVTPLNVSIPYDSHKFETVDRYYWQKCGALFFGVVICVIIIFTIVIAQADERPVVLKELPLNDTSNDTYVDSYNNTYVINLLQP